MRINIDVHYYNYNYHIKTKTCFNNGKRNSCLIVRIQQRNSYRRMKKLF